jgi:hypothetical protein
MARYPAQTAVVDALAPLFTMLKWSFLGASFALLVAGIVVGAWRWFKRMGRGQGGEPT